MAHGGSGVTGLVTKHAHTSGSRTHSGLSAAAAGPKAGYTGWWDASQVTAVADGAGLQTFSDLSGNGNHFVQNTAGNQPTYYKTTAGQLINGHPAVVFPLNKSMATAAGVPTGTTVLVVQLVAQFITTTGTQYVIDEAASHEPMYLDGTGFHGAAVGGTLTWSTPDTTAHVFTFSFPASGTGFLRVDRTQVSSVAQTCGLGNNVLYLGESQGLTNFWNGRVGEVVWYGSSTLLLADIIANENYLKAKWGTP